MPSDAYSRACELHSRLESSIVSLIPRGMFPVMRSLSSGRETRTLPSTTADRPDRAERIAAQRRKLPDAPGVYLFHDAKGKVLYVGKAASIKKRVASHFSNPPTRGGIGLLDEIDQIEFIATQ